MFRSLSPWKEGSLVPSQEGFSRSLMRFEEEMEDMVQRLFGGEGLAKGRFFPMADLVEGEQAYTLSMDLPGMAAQDVNVEVKDGELWITGERKEEKEEKGKAFHRTERRYGHFQRMFPLPKTVNEENIEACFEQGVLKITVPKTEEAKPRHIEVKA